MAWFVDEDRPLPALVLDGLGWGVGVGGLLGLLWGPVGVFFGALLGGTVGLLVGLVAGVLLAGWQRAGASPVVAAIGTLLPVLVLPALVAAMVSGVQGFLILLGLGIPAAGPLTADVVWRVRRWPARRAARSGPRCVLSSRLCVLVIR